MFSPNGHIIIYILRLENEKWYVGKTKNFPKRYAEHKSKIACEWTKLHPVLNVEGVMMTVDDYEEDKWVKKMMGKYGIDNVRGGTYCQIQLSKEQILLLQREIRTAVNACFKCGMVGHYVSECISEANTRVSMMHENNNITVKQIYDDRIGETKSNINTNENRPDIGIIENTGISISSEHSENETNEDYDGNSLSIRLNTMYIGEEYRPCIFCISSTRQEDISATSSSANDNNNNKSSYDSNVKIRTNTKSDKTNRILRNKAINVSRGVCYICQSKDHYASNCPNVTCTLCDRTGHKMSKCPRLCYCRNCKQRGHTTETCMHR